GQVIDAKGALVTPGFIEPHSHLLFGGDRAGEHARRLAGASYLDIAREGGGIRATVRATRAASDEELILGARARLDRLLRGGVTTAEVKSGYGLSVAEELRLLRLIREAGRGHGCEVVPTLLGLHAVPEDASRETWVRALAAAGTAAVLLPLAAWFLRDPRPAQAAPFLAAGATVALGGNVNPGSQRIESVSLLLAAGCLLSGLSPSQALWSCTAGAA